MNRHAPGAVAGVLSLLSASVLIWVGASAQPPATGGLGQPVPLPDPKITGFKFPEDEMTIIGWTKAGNQNAINLHGWGLWTALTSNVDGTDQRVFQTWLTPANVAAARLLGVPDLNKLERTPPTPTVPRQFQHGKRKTALLAAPDAAVNQALDTVRYDPKAAGHIHDNKLLLRATLDSLLAAGKTDVPTFPNDAIALKPTYVTAARSSLVEGRYFRLEAWPGTPDVPQVFDQSKWKQWVWIDVKEPGVGTGTGKVDTVGTPQSRTAETTYGLGLLHLRAA